jgi:uncharacterized protein (TIGR02246 family)
LFFIAIVLAFALPDERIYATDPDAAGSLQTALQQSADRFCEAFGKQDAKALAELFTPEAEYVDVDGTVFHGRAAIEAEFAASFAATPPGKLQIAITSIRPIADGVAVEEGISRFAPAKDGAASQSRYSVVHVRQTDGSWRMASVRELSEPMLTAADRLRALGWLLGNWREEGADVVVETDWSRTDDGSALIANFTMRAANGAPIKGTHRVGWDAERKQFRSWIFDSSGGFADGWWSAGADGSWSVQLHGVDAVGARISSSLRYDRDGDEALVISQRARTRGGVSLPDVSARVVRQPPKPGGVAVQK